MKRSQELMAAVSVCVLLASACGSSSGEAQLGEASAAVNSKSVTSAALTTTTTLPAATTSTTSTSTTTIVEDVLPLQIDDPTSFVRAAHERVFESGPVEVRVQSRTGSLDSGGRLLNGERLYIVNQWDGEEMSGSASFNGVVGISARGDGNTDLIGTMLLLGSTYSYDGEWVVVERQLFNVLSDDISADGGDWLKVRVEELDDQQLFALQLLAPYSTGRPSFEDVVIDDFEEELFQVEQRGDWAVYEYLFSSTQSESQSEFVVDDEGRIRESRIMADLFGESEQILLFRPLEQSEVRRASPENAEDVTEQFAAYATERYALNPDSLGG